ncbi:MAG TPA: hypothetical protein VL738_20205 [Dactylosporangium sp.]|nr:hypothetical protein [Dactylosporangium sp.]
MTLSPLRAICSPTSGCAADADSRPGYRRQPEREGAVVEPGVERPRHDGVGVVVFGKIVQQQGRPSPSPQVPSKNVDKVETLVGNYWSKAISGQGKPDQLANELLDQLKPLLKG